MLSLPSMADGAGREAYERARKAVDAGRFDEALAAAEEAYRLEAGDGPIRELYVGLHLARGVKLAAAARDLRRQEVVARDIRAEVEFEDSDRVKAVFQGALAAFDTVLAADPDNEKALMMKASTLHRFDRAARREEALGLLRRVGEAHPENRQLRLLVKKVERKCDECSDTGFCPHCVGRGSRTLLGFKRKCERCWGQGICLRCGVL
jgi:tetratricopeptide (TPR) repeat protein